MLKWGLRIVLAALVLVAIALAVLVGMRVKNRPEARIDLLAGSAQAVWTEAPSRPNILLLTVDDMNWDSAGVFGAPVADVTPHIDALAREGARFRQAFVTSPICQPSRSVWMTGLYPPRNGATGFNRIRADVATLAETLHAEGYRTGIVNKVTHTPPYASPDWDYLVEESSNHVGRDPAQLGRQAEMFFRDAALRRQPFFLNFNINDPHRPFAGTSNALGFLDTLSGLRYPPRPDYAYPPDIAPPPFLPDTPEIRREMAEYYTSVHRADMSVGEVLAALDRSGAAPYTVVILISDNGMAFPFGKSTLYPSGVRTPMIVRWPGRVAPGHEDRQTIVSGVDVAPTILDIADIEPASALDGRSLLPWLEGEGGEGPRFAFTYLARVNTDLAFGAKLDFTSRGVQAGDGMSYIWNGWANERQAFVAESMLGRTWPAMRDLARHDREIASRVSLYLHRTPEELFDTAADPSALRNLVADPAHHQSLARMRAALLAHLEATQDPNAERYRQFLESLAEDDRG